MAEDGKLKINSMMVMISISVRCRMKTLYIRRSFRSHLDKSQSLKSVEDIRRERDIAHRIYPIFDKCTRTWRTQGQSVWSKAGKQEQKQVKIMDRIMDSGASFHATYCKEELERFKLRSDKVCLAYDMTLDIAGVRNVVLKTYFGTSSTLKDVRFTHTCASESTEQLYGRLLRGSLVVGTSRNRNVDAVYGEVNLGDWLQLLTGGLGKQKNLSFIMSEKTRKLQRAGVTIRSEGSANIVELRIVEDKMKRLERQSISLEEGGFETSTCTNRFQQRVEGSSKVFPSQEHLPGDNKEYVSRYGVSSKDKEPIQRMLTDQASNIAHYDRKVDSAPDVKMQA
ncbi:hypothetical protein Tco_0193698 [Tanacetum coccineum]